MSKYPISMLFTLKVLHTNPRAGVLSTVLSRVGSSVIAVGLFVAATLRW